MDVIILAAGSAPVALGCREVTLQSVVDIGLLAVHLPPLIRSVCHC